MYPRGLTTKHSASLFPSPSLSPSRVSMPKADRSRSEKSSRTRHRAREHRADRSGRLTVNEYRRFRGWKQSRRTGEAEQWLTKRGAPAASQRRRPSRGLYVPFRDPRYRDGHAGFISACATARAHFLSEIREHAKATLCRTTPRNARCRPYFHSRLSP